MEVDLRVWKSRLRSGLGTMLEVLLYTIRRGAVLEGMSPV